MLRNATASVGRAAVRLAGLAASRADALAIGDLEEASRLAGLTARASARLDEARGYAEGWAARQIGSARA